MKLKSNIRLKFLMVLMIISQANVAEKMPQFLLGSWQINQQNKYEVWNEVDENHYQGQVVHIVGGKKISKEILMLNIKNGELIYQAQVKNQNEGKAIEFIGKATDINGFEVTNLDHDFPQIIKYEQQSTDKITAKVMDKNGEGFTQTLVRKELPTTIPDWFFADMEAHIGRWETDNSKYQSDNERFDTYVVEWQWGIGKRSMTGRLFGLENGKESPDFWHFRQYWDNLEQKAVVQQFGQGGVIGTGELRYIDDTRSELIQTFSTPVGNQWLGKHLNELNGKEFSTQSMRMNQEGQWQADREYIWYKQ